MSEHDEIVVTSDPAAVDLDAVHAYLSGVYILEAYRGTGLARRMMDAVMAHTQGSATRTTR